MPGPAVGLAYILVELQIRGTTAMPLHAVSQLLAKLWTSKDGVVEIELARINQSSSCEKQSQWQYKPAPGHAF
jgi:hypothetical protein